MWTTSQKFQVDLGDPLFANVFSPIDPTRPRLTRKQRRELRKQEAKAREEGSEVALTPKSSDVDVATLPQNTTDIGNKKVIDTAIKLSSMIESGNFEKVIEQKIAKDDFKFLNKFSKSKFEDELDLYTQLYKEKGYTKKDLKNKTLAIRAKAQFLFSKYLGGSMIELFEKNKSLADEMTTNMILYAGSRSSSSSPHFKASDVSAF